MRKVLYNSEGGNCSEADVKVIPHYMRTGRISQHPYEARPPGETEMTRMWLGGMCWATLLSDFAGSARHPRRRSRR